jgi:hypothetical protein
MKKIFIISGSALAVILFFLAIYNLAFQKKGQGDNLDQKNITAEDTKNGIISSTNVKNSPITSVTEAGVFGTFIDKSNKQLLYYSIINGIVWQLDDEGKNPEQLSSVILKNIVGAQWSPDRSMVITKFNREGKNVFYLYNYLTKASTQLKDGIDVIVWDGLGKKIIYKYFDAASKKRSINMANPDGSNWQVLVNDLQIKDTSIAQIPLSSLVSYWNKPSSKEETQLNIVGVTGSTNKKIFSGRFGADYLWSPDGTYALVSSLKDIGSNKMVIGTIDAYGANYKELELSTLASKCVWSGDSRTVYCAVPGDLQSNYNMPDDYLNNKFFTKDTFWKINAQTGKKELLVQPQDNKESYDATNLLLSSTESNLFFVDRTSNRLYKIKL